jgi:hypothetical protein
VLWDDDDAVGRSLVAADAGETNGDHVRVSRSS